MKLFTGTKRPCGDGCGCETPPTEAAKQRAATERNNFERLQKLAAAAKRIPKPDPALVARHRELVDQGFAEFRDADAAVTACDSFAGNGSTAELVRELHSRYQISTDRYWEATPKGDRAVRKFPSGEWGRSGKYAEGLYAPTRSGWRPSDLEAIKRAVEGNGPAIGLAVARVNDDGVYESNRIVFDVDGANKGKQHSERVTREIGAVLKRRGLPFVVHRSRSGNGTHLTVWAGEFRTDLQSVGEALRAEAARLSDKNVEGLASEIDDTEVFPKNEGPKTGLGAGSQTILPYALKRRYLAGGGGVFVEAGDSIAGALRLMRERGTEAVDLEHNRAQFAEVLADAEARDAAALEERLRFGVARSVRTLTRSKKKARRKPGKKLAREIFEKLDKWVSSRLAARVGAAVTYGGPTDDGGTSYRFLCPGVHGSGTTSEQTLFVNADGSCVYHCHHASCSLSGAAFGRFGLFGGIEPNAGLRQHMPQFAPVERYRGITKPYGIRRPAKYWIKSVASRLLPNDPIRKTLMRIAKCCEAHGEARCEGTCKLGRKVWACCLSVCPFCSSRRAKEIAEQIASKVDYLYTPDGGEVRGEVGEWPDAGKPAVVIRIEATDDQASRYSPQTRALRRAITDAFVATANGGLEFNTSGRKVHGATWSLFFFRHSERFEARRAAAAHRAQGHEVSVDLVPKSEAAVLVGEAWRSFGDLVEQLVEERDEAGLLALKALDSEARAGGATSSTGTGNVDFPWPSEAALRAALTAEREFAGEKPLGRWCPNEVHADGSKCPQKVLVDFVDSVAGVVVRTVEHPDRIDAWRLQHMAAATQYLGDVILDE